MEEQKRHAIDAFRRRGPWPVQWEWRWLSDGRVACLELQRDGMWHVAIGKDAVGVVPTKGEALDLVHGWSGEHAARRP